MPLTIAAPLAYIPSVAGKLSESVETIALRRRPARRSPLALIGLTGDELIIDPDDMPGDSYWHNWERAACPNTKTTISVLEN